MYNENRLRPIRIGSSVWFQLTITGYYTSGDPITPRLSSYFRKLFVCMTLQIGLFVLKFMYQTHYPEYTAAL